MDLLWWHWIVLGLALCLGEMLVPVFFMLWIGVAALLVGLLTAVFPISATWQILLWAIFSAAIVFLWLKYFRGAPGTKAGTSDAAIGEIGLMVRAVEPFQQGEILFQGPLMGSDRWRCVSDVHLSAGCRARVVRVDGNILKVIAA